MHAARSLVLALALAACAGADHPRPRADDRAALACPAIIAPEPGARVAYGVVTDARGAPIAGAEVSALGWAYFHGAWQQATGVAAITAADGSYRVGLTESRATLRFTAAGRSVVWNRVGGDGRPARVDTMIDREQPAGVIGVLDALVMATTRCADWSCPLDRAPADLWWTRADPCPAGATVAFELAADAPRVSVACLTVDHVLHGAATVWIQPAERAEWSVSAGWYDHGTRCGPTRDEPVGEPAFGPATYRDPD